MIQFIFLYSSVFFVFLDIYLYLFPIFSHFCNEIIKSSEAMILAVMNAIFLQLRREA